jgi:hypothetical protein
VIEKVESFGAEWQRMVETEVKRKQFSLVRLHDPPLTTRLAMGEFQSCRYSFPETVKLL